MTLSVTEPHGLTVTLKIPLYGQKNAGETPAPNAQEKPPQTVV